MMHSTLHPSDLALLDAVRAELAYEPGLDAARIGVVVNHGIVTLVGTVTSAESKGLAARATFRPSGVRALVNHLRIDEDGMTRWSDEAIALNAVEWLTQKLGEAARFIKIAVEKGHLTLSGTIETESLKATAAKEAAKLAGVGAITNAITVTEAPSAEDILRQIHETLEPLGELTHKSIAVDVSHGSVTLTGNVNSWHAREEAERAAWACEGVHHVENRLFVDW
ncbi:BON domain-containing protein [Pelagibacterium halotolerans]|uniref:BON domain-containing protein n=1 Tax=Pelagibacterium halotolerans TaxID=531813 RepID=UPI00384E30AC